MLFRAALPRRYHVASRDGTIAAFVNALRYVSTPLNVDAFCQAQRLRQQRLQRQRATMSHEILSV